MIETMESLLSSEWHYWSMGRHPDFGYDARVWRYVVDPVTKKRSIPHKLGYGPTLEAAVADLLAKLKA